MINPKEMQDKIKLIEELEDYYHSFLNKAGCGRFLKPFGIDVKLEKAKANPQDFKGLYLWDKQGNPINEAEGLSGLDISSKIAYKLGVKTLNLFGRGSQHQSNCELIIKHLKKVIKNATT